MQNKIYDVLVIGGGVVGAAVFNKLTRIGKKCLLIDKASDVSTGASKANSGIIHAGYDPKPNTLKARMNVRGNFLFPSLADRLGVSYKRCGALVVGDDEEKVVALKKRADENKVKAEVWHRDKMEKLVPNLAENLTVALFAENSYIVSPYMMTIALVDEGILNGGEVFLEQDIISAEKTGFEGAEVFVVRTKTDIFYAKNVVNSAGAGYNDVAKILGSEQKEIELRRGEYFVFDKKSLSVPLTIFPLPTAVGKGVLVTPTVDGNFLVGPTSEASDGRKVVTASGLKDIKEKSKMIENLNFRHAIREFSGIRAICGDDFVIEKSRVSGVINLAGICSPGLTSAPAIAEEVCRLLGYDLTEQRGLKKLPKYTLFKNMSPAEQKKALQGNPAYGEIVCKCEQITRGDVQMALSRPLKTVSVDGVKRRTNAGMGRCQGGFCFTKVVKEIASARHIDYCKVLKENRGSEVAKGEIRE